MFESIPAPSPVAGRPCRVVPPRTSRFAPPHGNVKAQSIREKRRIMKLRREFQDKNATQPEKYSESGRKIPGRKKCGFKPVPHEPCVTSSGPNARFVTLSSGTSFRKCFLFLRPRHRSAPAPPVPPAQKQSTPVQAATSSIRIAAPLRNSNIAAVFLRAMKSSPSAEPSNVTNSNASLHTNDALLLEAAGYHRQRDGSEVQNPSR